MSLADHHSACLLFLSVLPGRTAYYVLLPQLFICLACKKLTFDHSLSVCFQPWHLMATLLSLWLLLPLFDFSVSLIPCSFPACPLHAGAAWVPLSPSSLLTTFLPPPGTHQCPDSWQPSLGGDSHLWFPTQAFILNTRFRCLAIYWPSLFGCLMGFQTQHATNRTHHPSPHTCSPPFFLF